ncbi:MAG TPA: hypothetical protein GXX36_14580 [Clostridiaceae bacterium]|nr:hypothetical protein [Clostridiaceae bacterium]
MIRDVCKEMCESVYKGKWYKADGTRDGSMEVVQGTASGTGDGSMSYSHNIEPSDCAKHVVVMLPNSESAKLSPCYHATEPP